MILVDSNLVIYTRQRGYDRLREQLALQDVAVCSITQIEVLGWHLLEPIDKSVFLEFFNQAAVLQLDQAVIDQTIKVKRSKPKIRLGDSIIAGTALAHHLELWTNNTKDFSSIQGLKFVNPLEPGSK